MEDIKVCKGIEIHGTVFSAHVNTDITEDEFLTALFEMCEQHGWLFGGYTEEIDDSDE